MDCLTQRTSTSRELAELVGIPERQVEEHLPHIVKSLSRDTTRQFMQDPSTCRDCQFVFRDRTRFTTPSRCPRCRSEDIGAPQFRITCHESRSSS
ncbi:MAG: transcriptional regulator [Nitrospirales bacterium]|nr:transcriptional regulator [Nitrospirales bacterium]